MLQFKAVSTALQQRATQLRGATQDGSDQKQLRLLLATLDSLSLTVRKALVWA